VLPRWSSRAALILVIAVTALVAVGTAGSARTEQGYPDTRGDAGVGTDITGITVRNDASGGITFQIGIASVLPDNHYLTIFVDADNNASTGLAAQGHGLDYYVFGSKAFGIAFYRRAGAAWERTSPAGFGVGLASPNVVEFRLTRAMLGNTNGFTFMAFSGSGDVSGGGLVDTYRDAAGWFRYSLSGKPAPQCSNGLDDDGDGKIDKADAGCSATGDDNEGDGGSGGGSGALKITKLTHTPGKPYAGEWYTLQVFVNRVGRSGKFFGTVGCQAKVGGARAQWSGSVDLGTAKCGFFVPQNAAGRVITGLMTVSEGGTTLRRTFKATIVRQPQRLIAGKLVETVPDQPRAGALFGYKLPVSTQKGIRDSRPVVPRDISRVTCSARLGGKPITAKESRAVTGAVRCVWTIPYGAAGTTLAAEIRVESPQTASATAATLIHSFTRTVR
jgi:hypothetical protein